MSVQIHVLTKGGRLEQLRSIIERSFSEIIPKIEEKIDLPDVDVIFVDNSRGAIPETGVSGNAYTKHFVVVSINPHFPNIESTLSNEIKSTLAHELHHCARMDKGFSYRTLLEAIITEGLADHFDIEINGNSPRPWSIAVEGVQLEDFKKRASTEFNKTNFDHFAWFFGSEALKIPRWVGYSLGFDMVRKYIEKTNTTAAALVGLDASEIEGY